MNSIGRLTNHKNHPHAAAVGHLTGAACRGAASLEYLAVVDERRFSGVWPNDGFANDAIDDGHVRWAASGAVTCLDQCIAAASRLSGFGHITSDREPSVRSYYRVGDTGKVYDKRQQVPTPWRAWIDSLVLDPRYSRLLAARDALIHSDALRIVSGGTGPIHGHEFRYQYRIGSMNLSTPASRRNTIAARAIVELARDLSLDFVGRFVVTLEGMP